MLKNNVVAFLIYAIINGINLLEAMLLGYFVSDYLIVGGIIVTILYVISAYKFLNHNLKHAYLSTLSVSLFLILVVLWGMSQGGGEALIAYLNVNLVYGEMYFNVFNNGWGLLLISLVPSVLMYAGILIKQKVKGVKFETFTLKDNKSKIKKALVVIGVIAVVVAIAIYSNKPDQSDKKLYQAITEGNYQAVKEVLRDDPNISLEKLRAADYDDEDKRALGMAILEGNSNKSICALIDAGADVNSQDDDGMTYRFLIFSLR